jgi:hypothetical protein
MYEDKLKRVDIQPEPLLTDRFCAGLLNAFCYSYPLYTIAHTYHAFQRAEIFLTGKDPMQYKDCYREFLLSQDVFCFPKKFIDGDYLAINKVASEPRL